MTSEWTLITTGQMYFDYDPEVHPQKLMEANNDRCVKKQKTK